MVKVKLEGMKLWMCLLTGKMADNMNKLGEKPVLSQCRRNSVQDYVYRCTDVQTWKNGEGRMSYA